MEFMNKCNLEFQLSEDFRNRGWIRHVMKHTPIAQFRCHLCSFHCRQEKEMREHLKTTHELTNRSLPFEVTNFDYSKAETAMVDAKGRECFPDWALVAPPTTNLDFLKKKVQNRRSVDKTVFCKECGDAVEGNARTMYEAKENHIAACHTMKHIWKCGFCNFTSHLNSDVADHVEEEHGLDELKPLIHIKRNATHAERKEMAEMVVEFFPGTKVPGIILNST